MLYTYIISLLMDYIKLFVIVGFTQDYLKKIINKIANLEIKCLNKNFNKKM